MKIACLSALQLLSVLCIAQNNYSVSLIPDSLLKDADVVKRIDETIFTVKDLDKVITYSKVAYTILNEKGDAFGYTSERYGKLDDINTFDATLFDAGGHKIRGVRRHEVKDESAVSGISLMDDQRIKWFNFFYKTYPYTVEFIIETESKNTMFFPTWIAVNSERIGVMQSSLSVHCPKDYQLRYKLLGGATDAVKTETEKEKIYTWQIQNVAPVLKEPYTISWYELSPTVFVAPGKFVLQGYAGDMNSWQSFGKFLLDLKMNRDVLPENIKADVHGIVANLQTDNEKINALYKYLQDNTRYISVQLGIGGWQPFEASYVASKKYGDCKALSNYMTALLKEAGILSYYTVIRAGSQPNNKWFTPDFTNNSFNHIIVCVPNKGDTVWLECTDQRQYPGYMSDFTDNRYAFLITPEGGKIVKTPRYGVNENLQVRKINAVINEEGHMTVKVNTTYQAQQQDGLHGLVNALSKDKVNEVLKSGLDFPNYELVSYDYKPSLKKYPVMEETLDISAMHYAQVSGKRLFVLPNIMTRTSFKPSPDSTRKFPVRFDREYRDIDTSVIEIPAGYKAESTPKDMDFKSAFGAYKSSVKVDGNKIVYTRMIERYAGVFAATAYPDLVKFWEQVYKADRSKVVMVKSSE
jgi:hypothetical protein